MLIRKRLKKLSGVCSVSSVSYTHLGLKECRQLLKLATLGKYPGYLLEGMACPGGCVAGAGTMQAIKKSQTSVGLYAKQSTHKTSSETEYIKELDKLVD